MILAPVPSLALAPGLAPDLSLTLALALQPQQKCSIEEVEHVITLGMLGENERQIYNNEQFPSRLNSVFALPATPWPRCPEVLRG